MKLCIGFTAMTILALADASTPAAASVDNFDFCHAQVEKEYGPNNGGDWMMHVFECTTKLDAEAAEKEHPKSRGGECNFDKRVGSCTGTIRVISTSGSKGSYAAEITMKSSASSCSKVEYYLENTPYTSIIKVGNSVGESVFGTKPITKKSFSVDKCTTYEGQ
jgi:hypothetical protein